METAASVTIIVDPPSVTAGDSPEIVIAGTPPEGTVSVSYQVVRIGEKRTEWSLSSGGAVILGDGQHVVVAPPLGTLDEGLFAISALEYHDAENQALGAVTPAQLRGAVFRRSGPAEPATSRSDVQATIEALIETRESRFREGWGVGSAGFQCWVMLKDVLITQPLRFDHYELVPTSGLSFQDERRATFNLLQQLGQRLDGPEKIPVDRAEPTSVLWFPNVLADSVDGARDRAIAEADLLMDVLSLHRGAVGSAFSSIVAPRDGSDVVIETYAPVYRGNLAGGTVSGEDADSIARELEAVRNDDDKQVLVVLYREAIRETMPAIGFLRYWIFLETLARAQSFEKQPKRSWDGDVITDESGKALVMEHAVDIVYELLRTRLSKSMSETGLGPQLSQGSVHELVGIWYQRRNCAAHGKSCLCRLESATEAEGKTGRARSCFDAYQEDQGVGVGLYFDTIKTACSIVLHSELFGP